MKKEFIPYEQSVLLKELGFDEPCFKKYIAGCLWSNPTTPEIYENIRPNSSDCLAPLYQQAFRWFREKYFLHSYITCSCTVNEILSYNWVIHKMMNSDTKEENFLTDYEQTSEQAELECLKKLIEMVGILENHNVRPS